MKRLLSLGRRHGGALLKLLCVLVIWLGISAYQTRNHFPAGSAAAPAFTLTDLSGHHVSLEEYQGRKVVLHFFATWCGVCKAEVPSIRAVHRGLAPDEALLAIVADGEDAEHVRRFAAEHELTYPILLASDEVLRAYAVDRFPTNYYLNGDGSVSTSSTGLSTWLGMKARLLAASSKSAR